MDIRTLELFLSLASTLHFGKTGQACHISTSALSRTIQRLEAEVGRPLFLRDNRTVELSDTGRRFRTFARQVTDEWHHFLDSLDEEPGKLRGEILLYGSVTAASSVLSDLFAAFRTHFPNIHIRLETGDAAHAIEKIVHGTADITVAARPEELPKSLRFKTITTTPLIFIAPVVACETVDLLSAESVDWSKVPMILAEQALSRKRTEIWFRDQGIRPNIYAEVAGHEAILSMVRLGCGVGVIPKIVLDNSAAKTEIRILTEATLLPYEVGLCVHRKRLTSPAVRAFWNITNALRPSSE